MSRGHGTVQELILAHMGADWVTVADFAQNWVGDSRAAVESTRRACRKLAEEGLLEIGWVAWRDPEPCPTCSQHDWSKRYSEIVTEDLGYGPAVYRRKV